ncbi:hypothetical protein ACFWA9_04510 [Kitasatospora sp. NPDC059973]|uniref:hypothetical protein n=1 Tax=Kitasatospora sp. NPDC059973 TaxID=3347020 RepID=UPI0036BB1909
MSSQYVTATGGFAYGVIGADIHVFGDGTPLYILERWRPPAGLDDDWLREQPSRMLNARFAVVGFTGREQELRELGGWCARGPRRAARWLHGPGGQGKTRLAQELASTLTAAGWTVVTAAEGPGGVLPPPGSQDLRPDGSAGLLLLVDYADRWPLSSLTWLFSNALVHRTDLPVRILLLARGTDAWPALRASLANEQVSVSQYLLPPLAADGPGNGGSADSAAADPEGRHTMYRAALEGFAARYGIPPPSGPAELEHPEFGLVLAVHMAALVAVDAHATGRTPPAPVPMVARASAVAAGDAFDLAAEPVLPGTAGLALYLLDREQLNWARLHRERRHGRIATPPAAMNRAVFTAALGGSRSLDSGTVLVDALRLGHPTAEVLADHAVCYPPPDPARVTVLEPLYPDRLAEDFVALTLPGHRAEYPAQRWAPEAAAVTARHDDRPIRAVTTLAAAAERWPHVGPRCLFPLLDENPDLAVAAGAPALLALAELPSIADELLGEVLDRLPDPIPPDLVVAAAVLRIRLLELRLDVADGPGAMAGLLVNHGSDLGLLGRHEEAVRAALRAVRAFERLAVEQPEMYEADVGKSLTNYASRLMEMGRNADAAAAQERVVGIFRRLHGRDQPRYDLDLATALANLAAHLERTGRWTEAYRANQEAIEHYRRREADDPRFRAGLAVALTNAAALTVRADAGTIAGRTSSVEAGGSAPMPGDGIATAFEAVRVWRELADADPVGHRPDLAIALLNLRTQLARAARHEEAVAAITESIGLYRRLAGDNPLTYRKQLALALGLLRESLTAVGRHDAALDVGAESVALWRQLAAARPAEHEMGLVAALHGQNNALRAAGRPEDPEARARSPKVRLKDRVPRSGATVEVSGWGRAAEPPATRESVLRVAEQLARRQDWPLYWEAVCRCSLADAARLARRIPVRRWHPADRVDRALLEALRSLPARRTAALVAEAAEGATTRLPPELDVFNEDYISFAHARDALAVATITDDRWETIETLDLRTGTRTTLYSGPADHRSITCVDASTVIATRSPDHRGDGAFELVRHTDHGTTILVRGDAVAGARVATMLFGYVAGLLLFPAALVDQGLGSSDDLRQVGLGVWGLSKGTLIAVDPDGIRLVLCDGHVMVATDALLGSALAVGGPAHPDGIADVAFVGHDRLLTSGQGGGLTLWQLGGDRMRSLVERDTPRMRHLFSVPEWDVVGGKAPGEGRVHFLDPDALTPRPAPPALTGAEHLTLITTSPDGRYVAYAGQLAASEPLRRRDVDWHSRLHDLDHAGAVLQRPLTGLRLAATTNLRSAVLEARRTGNTHLHHLLTLALALAERSSGD